MKSIIVIVLSFLLMSSCNTFEEKETKMAATFTIAVPGQQVQLSGNPIIINATTTTTGKTSHQLLCRVTCTDGAIPGGPWIDSIAPKNGAATFDISGLVQTRFDYSYDVAKGDTFRFFDRDALAALVTVEIGESYIDANNTYIEEWDSSDPFTMTVLKGQLPRHEFNLLTNNLTSFWAQYSNTRFLTRLEDGGAIHSPEITVSSPDDMVKASFVVSENKTMRIASETFFTDGTSTEYIDPFDKACVPGKLYEIDIQKYKYNPDSKTIAYYKVYAFPDGSLSNAIYRVNVDGLYHETHNVLYFVNSFGALEALHCYGDVKEEISTKSETVVSDSYNFDPTAATVHISESSHGTKYTINTGFKSKYERQWIKDLLESEIVFLQIADYPLIVNHVTYNLLPVTIVPGSYTINDTSDDLLSIEFQIQVAHEY